MKFTVTQKAVIGLIIANIIWGAAFPIYKLTLDSIPPFTFAFLRFFVAAIILVPFVYRHLFIHMQDIRYIALSSVFGITATIGFLFLGLQLTSSVNAPIIISAGPIFLILGSIFFLHEKPKRKVIAGTFVSLIGVLLVVLQPFFQTATDLSVLGNVYILIATMSGIMHTLYLKKLKTYPPMTITFWTFLVGSLTFVPMMNSEIKTAGFLSNIPTAGWIGLLYAIFLSSLLAYYCFTYAIKHLVTNETGIFSYIDPFVTIIVAVPLLGETISWAFIFGAIFVFAGIFIAEGRIPYHPLHKLKSR